MHSAPGKEALHDADNRPQQDACHCPGDADSIQKLMDNPCLLALTLCPLLALEMTTWFPLLHFENLSPVQLYAGATSAGIHGMHRAQGRGAKGLQPQYQ